MHNMDGRGGQIRESFPDVESKGGGLDMPIANWLIDAVKNADQNPKIQMLIDKFKKGINKVSGKNQPEKSNKPKPKSNTRSNNYNEGR